jgi:hypothetical protein
MLHVSDMYGPYEAGRAYLAGKELLCLSPEECEEAALIATEAVIKANKENQMRSVKVRDNY